MKLKTITRCVVALALFALVAANVSAQAYEPNWESLEARPTPDWYLDAKLGIFIHWGVYSVPSFAYPDSYSEWYWHALNGERDNSNERQSRNAQATREFHARVYGKDFKYEQFAPRFKAELFDPDQWADVFRRSGAKYIVLTSKHHDG